MRKVIEGFWYRESRLKWLLWPFHLLMCTLYLLRRFFYRTHLFKQIPSKTPVVVVGNITLGGTGKTPFIDWLVRRFQDKSISVVVISRGYGGSAKNVPLVVTDSTDVSLCGDEPKMLQQSLQIPVIVDPERSRAVEYATRHYQPDVIISDDGLQHYKMARQYEFCIVDGLRLFGNRFMMPLGPLREPLSRLKQCDLIITNNSTELDKKQASQPQFSTQAVSLVNMTSNLEIPLSSEQEIRPFEKCTALCGIGNPDKFKQTLIYNGFDFDFVSFPDHHQFSQTDFSDFSEQAILMTEKDAIKCKAFAKDNWWFLKIDIVPNTALTQAIETLSKGLLENKHEQSIN